MPGVDPSGFMIRLIERQSMTRQRCGSPRKFRFGFASRPVSFLADLAFSPIGKTRPNIPSAVASVVSNSPLYRPERMESETFMGRIIAISGSLRRASFNSMLLRAASQVAPDGTTVEIASIRGIPLYDGDVESARGHSGAGAGVEDENSRGRRSLDRHARIQQFDTWRAEECD